MQEQLSAQKLHELNRGAAGIVINQEIQTALKDLLDRGPEDHKVRKVNITLTIGLIDNGDVGCYVEANHQLPKRRTKSTIGEVKYKNTEPIMVFGVLDPDDPRQRTIDDELAKQEEKPDEE